MKCSSCGGEMNEGLLVGEGGYWRPISSVPGIMQPSEIMGSIKINAFKCSNCQKVELIAKPDTNE